MSLSTPHSVRLDTPPHARGGDRACARNPAGSELLFGWRNGTEIPDTPAVEDDLHDEDCDPMSYEVNRQIIRRCRLDREERCVHGHCIIAFDTRTHTHAHTHACHDPR
jgi:hypothetical protein